MRKPIVPPNVLLSPAAGGYVAYDAASDQLHHLNPIASLIIELCDGAHDVDEVVAITSPLMCGELENCETAGPPRSAASEIIGWIGQAARVGLLVEADGETNHGELRKSLSADDLAGLADRLRDQGKIQTAYICQQQAVELASDEADKLRQLGELAHILGRRDEARDAYERFARLEPNDAEIQHLLVSLRNQPPPSRVPNACLEQLYQRFSEFYETNMCRDLGYEGPQHLRAVVDRSIDQRSGLSILDLGCGTGLCGLAFKDIASRIVGVDISPEMIAQAQQRGIYDQLHVAEITAWLDQATEHFDVIVACDTLIYFGDLRQVIGPAAKRLTADGILAFSVERADSGTFRLTDNGRYVHHRDHIAEAAKQSNLSLFHQSETFLRLEYGNEVMALYSSLRANHE